MADEVTRCKECVPNYGRDVGFHQCTRAAVRDGYCKQHHPDSVAERQKKSDEAWEKKQANSPLVRLSKAQEEIKSLRSQLKQQKEYRLLLAGAIGFVSEISVRIHDEDERDSMTCLVHDWCELTGWDYKIILDRIDLIPPTPEEVKTIDTSEDAE